MPGVPLGSASDVESQSRLDPATDPGVAAATAVCDALVKKNMASAKDLQPLMPVLQTILHPDYLSALGSGHAQIPVITQIRAVVTMPPSSPDSIMLGSQILNAKHDAQEIRARLNAAAACRSNKRERHYDGSTSSSSDEGSSLNSSPRLKKHRSNQRKRMRRQRSSSKCESPNPHRRHPKARRSHDNGSLSDGVQSQTRPSSRAPEDGEALLPRSRVDIYRLSAPNPLQEARSDAVHEQ